MTIPYQAIDPYIHADLTQLDSEITTATGSIATINGEITTINGEITALQALTASPNPAFVSVTTGTPLLTQAATTSLVSCGGTLASQTLVAGSAWRIRVMGQYQQLNSATARTHNFYLYWGSTQLTACTTSVGASLAQTTAFLYDGIIQATSTTAAINTAVLGNLYNGTEVFHYNLTAATAVTGLTAGAQTIDFKTTWSTAAVADVLTIWSVTMERLV